MANPQGVWGIDLGQCALKALRVEMIEGQLTATAFDYVEHPKILSQPDADPDQLTREALEKFLERNSLRGDLVAISVPGQSGLARFVKLPPVEEKKIPDIVRFEAKQQIPFNLDEVVWDYQKIGTGAVTDGFAMETEIGLFAIKRDTVNKYLQHFTDVNVEVHTVQMSPLALCNFVSFDLLNKGGDAPAAAEDEEEDEETAGKKKCVVALDIGTDNSNLVITDGERIIWQRPIPLGGNHFTRALTKDLKLTFAKAEHLKRNATKSPDLKKILLALRPVLNDFVGEVQRSLSYFTSSHKNVHVKYMMGLGNAFRLPGLQKFLSEKLQLEVRKLGKMNRLGGDSVISAPSYVENILSFAVSYGLAVQGLKLPRLQTNLLPQEIRTERMIRAKKPWAAAAAASLLFGASVMTMGYGFAHQAVSGKKVDDAINAAKGITDTAARNGQQFDAKNAEIEKNVTAVKSILAGSGERYNWLEFTKFLSEAMPRPDGSNLLDKPTEEKYWGKPERRNRSIRDTYLNEEARRAFSKFIEEQTGAGGSKDKDDDEGLEHLIQANLVGVHTMYSDNLENVYSRLLADRNAHKETMRPKDAANPPKGKGWIVELRGYSYHKDRENFVELAVVRNLASYRLAETEAAAAAATPGKQDGSPPPVPQPGSGAPPAGGTEGMPTQETIHPTWGRISHVLLYRVHLDDKPEGQPFKILGGSYLSSLLGGSGGGAGDPGGPAAGGGGGGRAGRGGALGGDLGSDDGPTNLGGGSLPGGPTGGGRGGWQPLGSLALQGGTAASSGAIGLGGPGEGSVPGGGETIGIGGPGRGTPDSPGGSGGTAPEKSSAKKKQTRTEFVILLVWQEPTPSDDLLGSGDTPTGDPASGAPAAPSGGGLPAPPGGG